MYNDQDLEFDDCHSINTWNIFIQTDVYNVQECIPKYMYSFNGNVFHEWVCALSHSKGIFSVWF